MPGCRYLGLKVEDNPKDPEDLEFYWWCKKLRKYVGFKKCTIIPCAGKAIGGCESADFNDYFKEYGYEMAEVK